MTIRIYLARHGQPTGNGADGLTPLGRQQAHSLAAWLHDNVSLTRIRSSCLPRAQQTAVPIADTLNLPLIQDQQIWEAGFRVYDHLPMVDSPYASRETAVLTDDYRVFRNQAQTVLNTLIQDAEETNGPVLAVAHGGLITTIFSLIANSEWLSFWMYHTGLHLVEWMWGRWHLIHLNRLDHLSPDLVTF